METTNEHQNTDRQKLLDLLVNEAIKHGKRAPHVQKLRTRILELLRTPPAIQLIPTDSNTSCIDCGAPVSDKTQTVCGECEHLLVSRDSRQAMSRGIGVGEDDGP